MLVTIMLHWRSVNRKIKTIDNKLVKLYYLDIFNNGGFMKIRKDELEDIYNSMTNKEAAKKIGCSVPTLLKLVKNAGIESKGRGYHGERPEFEVID